MSPIDIGPDGTPIVVPSVDAPASTSGGTSFVAPPITDSITPATPVTTLPPTPITPEPIVEEVIQETLDDLNAPATLGVIKANFLSRLPPILKNYGMDTQQQQKAMTDIAELLNSLS